MIKFFRDVLNGPLYIVIVIISLILIMAIIGRLMEKKQKKEEAEGKIAHVGRKVKNNVNEIPSTTMENAEKPQE